MLNRPERARDWLAQVLDPGWELLFDDVAAGDPLRFPGYTEQLAAARRKTAETESVAAGAGTIGGSKAIVCAFEFAFLGGSMGMAAGERVARAFERAARDGAAVVAVTRSGGARMQEGMLALAQMPSTIAARQRLAEARLPFVAYLAHPTTGGVYASFSSLADLVWAEPGATIGFAGPRVAETMTGRPLPEGSHTAEAAHAACLADALVAPEDLRARLSSVLATLGARPSGDPAPEPAEPLPPGRRAREQVGLARDAGRPSGRSYADVLLERAEPVRRGAAAGDPTIITALGRMSGRRTMVIAQDRHAGDGRTRPDGFRRARAAIATAVRLGLPIVTLVDTPGADPSADSESAGVAREIALMFESMLTAPVPTVACVVGEGGSGGALALAVGDRILIQENAIFSVIAPEGAAAILGRADVDEVAGELRLTAHDLREHGLADLVVAEPQGGAHAAPADAAALVRSAILWALDDLRADRRFGSLKLAISRRQSRWRDAPARYLA